MRILITSDIFPPDVGGPATYVPLIATSLVERGHAVRVLTYSRQPLQPTASDWPFELLRIPVNLPMRQRLPRTVEAVHQSAQEADVIYANGLVSEVVLANVTLRRPVVAKVVGDLAWERCRDKGWVADDLETFQRRRYGLGAEMMRWRRSASYQRMDRVVVPSAYLQRILLTYWGLQRVQVIYNAFIPVTPSAAPIAIGLSTQYRLITVARLTGWKGVEGLIDLLPSLPQAGLVVVGDGPLRGELEARACARGVQARVLFTGVVPRANIPALLSACDVFGLNSIYEGLPHIVLEAFAAQVPIIATNAGGTGEVVEHGVNGMLVTQGDAAALRGAVQEVLNSREVSQQLVAGGLQTLERFGVERMVDETEAMLRAVVEARR